jgi:hypothetical protein
MLAQLKRYRTYLSEIGKTPVNQISDKTSTVSGFSHDSIESRDTSP